MIEEKIAEINDEIEKFLEKARNFDVIVEKPKKIKEEKPIKFIDKFEYDEHQRILKSKNVTIPIEKLQGCTGFQGRTGICGLTGIQRTTGLYGETGCYGSTGVQGLTGTYGYTGIYGMTRTQGETGICGVTGIQGETDYKAFIKSSRPKPTLRSTGGWSITA